MARAKTAAFRIGGFTLSATESVPGEKVTVSVMVTNEGDLSGTYHLIAALNGTTVKSKDVTLAGGGSESLTFDITPDTPGTYEVNVNGLSGTFVIANSRALAPASFSTDDFVLSASEAAIGETITASVLVTNSGEMTGDFSVSLKVNGITKETKKITLAGGESERVSFSTVEASAGSYSVDVGGFSSQFTVLPAPAIVVSREINWWFLAAGICGFVAALTLVVLTLNRRRAYQPLR